MIEHECLLIAHAQHLQRLGQFFQHLQCVSKMIGAILLRQHMQFQRILDCADFLLHRSGQRLVEVGILAGNADPRGRQRPLFIRLRKIGVAHLIDHRITRMRTGNVVEHAAHQRHRHLGGERFIAHFMQMLDLAVDAAKEEFQRV